MWDQLWKQLLRIRDEKFKADSKWQAAELELQRRDGIRFILRTSKRVQEKELLAALRELLRPDIEFEFTLLFPGSNGVNVPALSEAMDLGCFWELRIRRISFFEVDQNPFELAYSIRRRLNLRACFPDVPFLLNTDPGGSPPV